MAGSSRARISSIVTEPFDPVYGLESWVEEGDDHSAAPAHPKPGFDPVYPFSPYQGDSGRPAQAGWQAGPDQGLSQRYSPHDDIVSPLSHGQQSGFPETNEFRPLRISSPPGHAVLRDTANQYDPPGNRASTYSIPEAPPPPRYPETNFHDSGFLQPGATPDDMEMQRRQRSQLGVKRQGSIMQRVGTRIMGTVKGNRNSQGWRGGTLRRQQTTKQAGEGVDTDYMELTGKGEDGDEAIGFDVSTFDFGPEFAVPHAAAQAMENKGFDEDYAYTGLSSGLLRGLS